MAARMTDIADPGAAEPATPDDDDDVGTPPVVSGLRRTRKVLWVAVAVAVPAVVVASLAGGRRARRLAFPAVLLLTVLDVVLLLAGGAALA
jgi:hypothetical protein